MMSQKVRDLVRLPFKYYEPKPGHPDWAAINKDAVRLAIQILKNQEPFSPGRKMYRSTKRVLAILKTMRNFFRNKIRMAKSNHNFIPLFYIWTMTNACNFTCSFCSNHRGGKYPLLFQKGETRNLSTAQGKQLLGIMKDASAIYFCGGEPTIRRDLPELLDYSSKLRIAMFNMINTNGSLIGDLLLKPRYRKFLSEMDVIIVSLDAMELTKLAAICKTSESVARKVIRNILALRILKHFFPFKLSINIVVGQKNFHDAFDVLDWCNDLGLTFAAVAENIVDKADQGLLANPEYQQLVDKILSRAEQGYPMIASKYMLDRLLRAKFTSCFPRVFDHIDHDGTLFWPCKTYPQAIKVDVLKHKNVAGVHAEAAKMINPAFFHGKGPGKCNGECTWMQDCVTDFYAGGLIHGLFDGKLLKEIRGLLQ
nr:radical SAM protein [Candidatus Sigynarchaeota archaeon]